VTKFELEYRCLSCHAVEVVNGIGFVKGRDEPKCECGYTMMLKCYYVNGRKRVVTTKGG